MKTIDLLIIGAGPAGLTAGLYAARGGRDTVIAEKVMPGGQMATSSLIENYPGFPDGIDGASLAMQMQQQAEKAGARIWYDPITGAEKTGRPVLRRNFRAQRTGVRPVGDFGPGRTTPSPGGGRGRQPAGPGRFVLRHL